MRNILVKKLTTNDTNSNIHQAGIFVSNENAVISFFPELDEKIMNPRAEILFLDDEGNEWIFNYIHYNNKAFSDGTRDEYRITGMSLFLKDNHLSEGHFLFFWKELDVWRISSVKPDEINEAELPSKGWKALYLEESDVTLENSENIQIIDNDEEYNEEPELWDTEDLRFKPIGEVRVTKKDYSVYELYRKYKKEHQKLYLDVSFQRNRVWTNRQKNELIESILLGLPLPIFYFKQESDASLSVIDGKQRLSAIFSFINDEYKLKGLKILKFINGKKYSDLIDEFAVYQTQLEDYQLYSHVIMPPTPDRYIFEIFGRVNKAGTKLNKQEIRNAMYHGPGMELIKRLAESDVFERTTGISFKKDKRMKNQYMLTRFISFYFLRNEMLMREVNGKYITYVYDGQMDYLLEKGIRRLNAFSTDDLLKFEEVIIRALELADKTLGRRAFRRYAIDSNPLNQILFEIEMYCFTKSIEENCLQNNTDIAGRLIRAAKDKKFNEYLDRSRDNKSDVNNRFNRFLEVFYEERKGNGK